MSWLKTIFDNILGLFVDDGRFALAIAIWLLLAALTLPNLAIPPAGSCVLLFTGLAAILVINAAIAARREGTGDPIDATSLSDHP